jgi:hypothetical protein
MGKFLAPLALGLILSTSALSQTSQNPTPPGKAPPATSSTTDDDGTNPLTHAGEDYSPAGQRPGAQQLPKNGIAPGPTERRESPTVNGKGTAGEGARSGNRLSQGPGSNEG